MSLVVMKTYDVIERCKACIKAIDEDRATEDSKELASTFDRLEKRNSFRNRITFGLIKKRSHDDLMAEADFYLRDELFYPSHRSGYWRDRAIDLRDLAAKSCSETMTVDSKDAPIINWTK